jgi:carboxymethylenebutenolidase
MTLNFKYVIKNMPSFGKKLFFGLLVLFWIFPIFNLGVFAQENQNREHSPFTMSDVAVVTEEPTYFENVSGFLVKPEEEGAYPGVIMIHEFWGLNDSIKNTASDLAREGYVVLAVDLYEGEVATDRERAQELSSSVDQGRAVENMRSAVRYLRENENVSRVASLGWCFGGGQSLSLAVSGEDLSATVIYYGPLSASREELERIRWPVLGIFGEEDEVVSVESVENFQRTLNDLNIQNEIYLYLGVGHAFSNPSGENFSEDEALDAWARTLNFLEENLKV